MFSRALAQGGPCLCEGLPCTLQPNPVHLAAPPLQRRLALLSACLIYTTLALALVVLAKERRALVAVGGHRPQDFVLVDQDPVPPPPVPSRPAAPGMNRTTLPSGAPAMADPVPNDAVPLLTPSVLPTRDLSHEGGSSLQPSVTEGVATFSTSNRVAPVVGTREVPPVVLQGRELKVLSQIQPSYPALARAAHIEGPVVLLMTVDAQGLPSEVQVVSGPHASLCNEAQRVARLWRFEPAMVDGEAVPAQFRLTVVFRLGR